MSAEVRVVRTAVGNGVAVCEVYDHGRLVYCCSGSSLEEALSRLGGYTDARAYKAVAS